MATIKQDEKHIADTLENDQKLANEIKSLSDGALKELSSYLNDWAERNTNVKGIILPLSLNKLPSQEDANTIKKIIGEINVADDDDVIYIKQMVNNAGSNYKISRQSYIEALITIIMAKHLHAVNKIQKTYINQDIQSDAKYLTQGNGDLKNVAKNQSIDKFIPEYQSITDEKGNNLLNMNYTSVVGAVSVMTAATIGKVRQGVALNDFKVYANNIDVVAAKVSMHDVMAHGMGSKALGYDLSGGFQRADVALVRNYRTISAYMHSQFRYKLANYFKITQATIINEMNPCKICVPYVGRIYDVATATAIVPLHVQCRCDVKLITDNSDISDIDSDDD